MKNKTLKEMPEFLTTTNLIELGLFKCHPGAYNARARNIGPRSMKIGGNYLYRKSDVVSFIEQGFGQKNKTISHRAYDESKYYDTNDIVKLGIYRDKNAVGYARDTGKFPVDYIKQGRYYFYDKKQVDEYIEQHINVRKVTMKDIKAFQHMLAWAIQHIYQTQNDAKEVADNKELSEERRIELLQGKHGLDYKLLNLILLLQPALEQAKEEYPEQEKFFQWFEDRWNYIQEQKYVKGECECKGCKKPGYQDYLPN